LEITGREFRQAVVATLLSIPIIYISIRVYSAVFRE
jgi:hypothetical protein